MANRVFNAISREGDETITLSVKTVDDKVVAVTARGEDGREYNVCLQFTKKGSGAKMEAVAEGVGGGGGGDIRFCCCVDEVTGQMVCQKVNGPCPPCADTDDDDQGGEGGHH